MGSLTDFALREEYKRVAKLGDKLSEIEPLIDWDAFRPIVIDLFCNKTEKGGRPNIDEVVMIKMLVLQEWHGLSDPELERQVADRISFRRFLGFSKVIPDYSTVWFFRERLIESGKDRAIWNELQRQLDSMGLCVKHDIIQDATFITSDPGHAKADKPRGDESKTRRSRDGTWAKKGNKSFFGCVPKGYDATMKRSVRGHPLSIRDKLRNKRISKKRAPGERPYAVIKNVFKSGHVRVTTVARVHVKMIFAAFSFNLHQLLTLKKQGMV